MAETIEAWKYELASFRNPRTGEYSGWLEKLTVERPNVPKESIRNLRPLYAGSPFDEPRS